MNLHHWSFIRAAQWLVPSLQCVQIVKTPLTGAGRVLSNRYVEWHWSNSGNALQDVELCAGNNPAPGSGALPSVIVELSIPCFTEMFICNFWYRIPTRTILPQSRIAVKMCVVIVKVWICFVASKLFYKTFKKIGKPSLAGCFNLILLHTGRDSFTDILWVLLCFDLFVWIEMLHSASFIFLAEKY